MEINKKIILIGAGGHGLVLADIAKLNGYNQIYFIDDAENKKYKYPILGKTKEAHKYIDIYDFFISIGDNQIRQTVFDYITDIGGRIVNLIHPNAVIAEDCLLDNGIAVMANVVINSSSTIKKGSIINTSSSIDHENEIGEFVHISPGCHLAGQVKIGSLSWLGIGSIVSNGISIYQNVIVGANSTVIKDINQSGVYIGTPTRRID